MSSTLSDTPLAWPMVLPSKPRSQRLGSVCAAYTHQSEDVSAPWQTLQCARALFRGNGFGILDATNATRRSKCTESCVRVCVCGWAAHALL